MICLAVDPGTTESGYVLWNGTDVMEHAKLDNEELLKRLPRFAKLASCELVIEKFASYGMAVGGEVFQTIFWSGRFAQAWGRGFHEMFRRDIKLHLCGNARAKDGNIRLALMDKLGRPGTKSAPGPTYGIRADEWAALGIAVTFTDCYDPTIRGFGWLRTEGISTRD